MDVPTSETTPTAAALPTPPFVDVEGIPNFRDIGGWPVPSSHPSSPHRSIRRHFVYRCAQTSHVTPAGEAKLRANGITTMYDLRSQPELDKMADITPIKPIDGVHRAHVPVYKSEDYSPEKLAAKYKDYSSLEAGEEGFVRAYRNILQHAGWSYKPIFEHIRDRPGEGFVVHCTAGKDRTGVFVALVLKLAGVEDEVVAREYSLTTQGLGDWRRVMMERLAGERGVEGEGRKGVERMVGSRYESMMAVLDMLDKEWGGAEGWLSKECEFGKEDFEKMRRNLIAEDPPIL